MDKTPRSRWSIRNVQRPTSSGETGRRKKFLADNDWRSSAKRLSYSGTIFATSSISKFLLADSGLTTVSNYILRYLRAAWPLPACAAALSRLHSCAPRRAQCRPLVVQQYAHQLSHPPLLDRHFLNSLQLLLTRHQSGANIAPCVHILSGRL